MSTRTESVLYYVMISMEKGASEKATSRAASQDISSF